MITAMKQREKEEISKVQRREQRQLVEEGRKKKEEQNTSLLNSNAPDSSHQKVTPMPAPEREKRQT